MLGHQTGLDKLKKTEIRLRIFSEHNALKGEVNCKEKAGKTTNMEIKRHATKQQMDQRNNTKQIKNT